MNQLDDELFGRDRQNDDTSDAGHSAATNSPAHNLGANAELAIQSPESTNAASVCPPSGAVRPDRVDLTTISTEPKPSPVTQKQVYVCMYRTCQKDGSAQVLAALQAQDLPNVIVSECGCMGLCGSGPMVMVAPDDIYYWRVRVSEVAAIAEHHLRGGVPIASMMHPRVHPDPQQFMPGTVS
jgi:(2Fe-2S) ferredoxin